jgi:hypothetical protein
VSAYAGTESWHGGKVIPSGSTLLPRAAGQVPAYEGDFNLFRFIIMANANETPPAENKRFRVYLLEKLHYTVDVLAKDEDEACDLALESEYRSEAECTFFDAEDIAVIADNDNTFNAGNACMKCGARIEEEMHPHCTACIEAIKAGRKAA